MSIASEIIIVSTLCIIVLFFSCILLLKFAYHYLREDVVLDKPETKQEDSEKNGSTPEAFIPATEEIQNPALILELNKKRAHNALLELGINMMKNSKEKIFFYINPESDSFLRTDHWTPNELRAMADYMEFYPEVIK